MSSTAPSLFVGHGSPNLATDNKLGKDYQQWGLKLTKPKAALCFSAHWQTETISIGAIGSQISLIYDFSGFSPELYDIQYPVSGASWLLDSVRKLLANHGEIKQLNRGIDHGVWVPLVHLWPQADVALMQLSMPSHFSSRQLFELGQTLGKLRREDVMIIGSGSLTHNLSLVDPRADTATPTWARDFDTWVEKVLVTRDLQALLDWRNTAPGASKNHPTPEHFNPLLVAAGAGWGEQLTFPVTGFEWASISRRSVQFGGVINANNIE